MNKPEIRYRPTPSGTECWVHHVPDNKLDIEYYLPSKPPWQSIINKRTFWEAVNRKPPLTGPPECNINGLTLFQVKGLPDDSSLGNQILLHESVHGSDSIFLFYQIIGDWDRALTQAQKSRTLFRGASQSECRANLFKAMDPKGTTKNGTPKEMAEKWISDVHLVSYLRHTILNNPFPYMSPVLVINPKAENIRTERCILSSVNMILRR